MGDLAGGKLRARLAALRGDLKQKPKATQHRVRHGLETLQHDAAELPTRVCPRLCGQANHGYDDHAARRAARRPALPSEGHSGTRRAIPDHDPPRPGDAGRSTQGRDQAKKSAEPAATAGQASE